MAWNTLGKGYAAYVVSWICFFLAIPLWREFQEPGRTVWNGFLAVFLVALVLGSFLGIRHIQRHRLDVGEARFKSPTTGDD